MVDRSGGVKNLGISRDKAEVGLLRWRRRIKSVDGILFWGVPKKGRKGMMQSWPDCMTPK
jgi:hypothetical protein